MATSHNLSDVLLGQAGGSEFGIVGNIAEFSNWFLKRYGYPLRAPVAYIKVAYTGGHSEHKLEAWVPGYLVLTIDRIVFFSTLVGHKFAITIPLTAINRNLMFVEAKGFTRLALTVRDRDKFLKTLENADITPEGKKILSGLPQQAAALARQRFNKADINEFVKATINLAQIVRKRTLHIPFMSHWGLEKPKFWLGINSPGLAELIYAWARVTLRVQ